MAAVAFVAVLAVASPAWAHAQLVAATPSQDATLTASPATVELTFSEDLNPEFVTVALSNATRQRLPTSTPSVAGPTATVTPGGPLVDGVYTVAYRVVSADGHTVQGSYDFTVGTPAQPVAAARASTPSGLPWFVLAGLGVLGLALAGAAAYFYAFGRRKRP
ncbi:copper resistance protein CopC [Actinoplanes sp. Pm04-4]|uniref:Copper resistance protein CopC n=1 Tax=Paractinoplanes pyxinae TaxID=2997416 RepID=A0ABT4AV22_9ACTN|nr:copper resistance CopC family protein [Actinoplanes pyxinae]MCY1137280.1 copper resistance protein CopC [Actinoplanes pyxinae]